ncbi:hypothetical protein MASR2M70_01630 [Bacillota bacterium]
MHVNLHTTANFAHNLVKDDNGTQGDICAVIVLKIELTGGRHLRKEPYTFEGFLCPDGEGTLKSGGSGSECLSAGGNYNHINDSSQGSE